jgi:hypothetical protein
MYTVLSPQVKEFAAFNSLLPSLVKIAGFAINILFE